MTYFYNRKKSGFSLVELIVAMALLTVISLTAFAIMMFGGKVVKASNDELDFQFSSRTVLRETSEIIRFASAVFTIPQSSFRPDNLCSGWDYIGINQVLVTPAQDGNPAVYGQEIVKYMYDDASDTHRATVLMPGLPKVNFGFVFDKINPQNVDNLLQFTIKSYPEGSYDQFGQPRAQLSITSEVEARNSLQVVDLASILDPAYAIAFRSQDRTKSVVGHVAMVLDKSGSMAWDMAGREGRVPSRLSILKNEANTLIDSFALEDNIDIALVPFSTSANNPNAFVNSQSGATALHTLVNAMNAVGGTNTGDGLRRAYWGLTAHNATVPAGVTAKNYVIILVDGVTTFASVISNSNRNFYMDSLNVREGYLDRNDPRDTSGQIAGNGSDLDAKGTGYVNAVGALLRANSFAKSYVIGFSSLSSDWDSVNDIADACGATSDCVFRADSQDALAQVFTTIRQDIVNDLWYLQGPDL